ncbi:MAG TPA: nucleotide pyrophosphatase/phosphodiesterase family protein [Gemmataceae bacterium]|nr:nucleotide pyrophosphatase/phosphodiesterase family protein [Gemmataceae bacterium]
MPPLVLINAVGLTPRLLPHAPHLHALAGKGWMRPLREVLPAVTCTAQASMLTGVLPEQHGIVGNGWLYRDTMEVRFWQQSNHLIQAEPLYVTAKKRNPSFRCAKLFWWFNQGADVAISVTPKPHYGIDGNKVFGIHGTPEGLTEQLERDLGPFPFATFWGPMAELPCTNWIAKCAAKVLREHHPDLTLIYLPHLDYDPQRYGPEGSDMPRLVRELDESCRIILDAAQADGANVWVVSEYGHVQVKRPVYLNRVQREAGLLQVRRGPFGEQLDGFASRAFAVCDHQLAHVYVADADDLEKTRTVLSAVPGVAKVLAGDERGAFGLLHRRSGELIVLSERDAWFAYPFWLDDNLAPDYARTVAIRNKPGYDPCELFFDPNRPFVKGRAAFRLLQKKLGFRMKMDVIPLDASIVRGSHGLAARDPQDRPLLIGTGPAPGEQLAMTDVHDLVLQALSQ